MAEQKGFLTAIAEPVGEAMRQHHASSPRDQNFTRAGLGAFLLVACAYTASWSFVFLGDDFGNLIGAFRRTPTHPPVALMMWAGFGAFGLLWFCVGVRGARGPRDIMAAFWAAMRVALFACALIWRWYLPTDLGYWVALANLTLHGIYLGLLAEAVVHFLLAARGTRGNAAGLVAGQIQRTSIIWRIGRRRKF